MIPNTSDNKLPKSELTKLRIIESFLKLIKKKRWDKLSVKEICAALISHVPPFINITKIFSM